MKATKRLLSIALSATMVLATISAGAFYSSAVTTSVDNTDINSSKISALGTSLISGKTPMNDILLYDWSNNTYFYTNEGSANDLTDGNLDSTMGIWNGWNVRIGFDLGGLYSLDKILVAGLYNNSTDYSTAKYDIYASETEYNLLDSSNKITSYDNSGVWKANSATKDGSAQILSFSDTKPVARYVAIIITQPNPTDNETRISEIGVYGTNATVNYTQQNKGISQETVNTLGTNIIAGKVPLGNIPLYSNSTDTYFYVNDGAAENFTDGNLDSKADIWNGVGMSFAYDLGAEFNINDLMMVSYYNSTGNYCTLAYELFVSDSADSYSDVFAPGNKVLTYEDRTAWTANSPTNDGSRQIFTMTQQLTGRYVGIRIVKPCGSDNVARLAEIGVYGEAAVDANVVNTIDLINKLPAKATFFNKENFVTVYDSYNKLNETQKANVPNAQTLLNAYSLINSFGDLNIDTSVNIKDLVRMKKLINAGSAVNAQTQSGDFDGNAIIDVNDMFTMREILLGIYNKNAYYNLSSYMQYYWAGNTVYDESVTFQNDANGNLTNATLMYTPSKIISVRSIDLNKLYVEGVDYIVVGNQLVLTPGSSIIAASYDTLYPKYASGQSQDWLVCNNDNTRYTSVTSLRDYQVAVTYTHSNSWTGMIPSAQLSELPNTKAKLENGGALNVVFYGDSITAGYEASGQSENALSMNTLAETTYLSSNAPYMPAWATMVSQQLSVRYPNATINKINRGAPSSDSTWGKTNVNLVTQQNPDLVVIAFGMNEPNSTMEYKSNITSIINSVLASNPNAEFLLVSSCVPNSACNNFTYNMLSEQETLLYSIQSEMSSTAIAVAPVNSMNAAMLATGKKITDGLNNNLNHPNDFIIRLYAQTISATLS